MKIHAKPPQKTQALVVFPPLLTAKAVPRPGRPAPPGCPGQRAHTQVRPYDSGRTKWARGSGRSHKTTCPAAKERGTSMSRWLVLPRNRAA